MTLPCKLGQCNLGHLDLITKHTAVGVGSLASATKAVSQVERERDESESAR